MAFIGGRGVISKYSGIEAYYEEVGRRLVQMGHEVTVYCRNYFTPAQAEHNGMRLVRLPTIRSKHLETVVHTLLSTAHALTQGYDLVHYHALGPALFSFLPRLVRSKTAVTVQGLDWQRKKWGRAASWVLRAGRGRIVPPSQRHHGRVASVAASGIAKPTESKPFMSPTEECCGSGPSRARFWNGGSSLGITFCSWAGFHRKRAAICWWRRLSKLDTGVKLVMAGASSYCDDYSRELRTHASDRIRMLDWVSGETLDELLTNAMIFVLPSDLEGLSLALLDAMGAGLCVLTSDVPENREVVDEAGFTFQRGNAADLADRLRFLIANRAVREAAGKAAKRRIREQYQWQKIAGDIEEAYFEMIGEKPRDVAPKKPSARAVAAGEDGGAKRRAG